MNDLAAHLNFLACYVLTAPLSSLWALHRLRKIEEDHYGDVSFAPQLNKTRREAKQPSLTER